MMKAHFTLPLSLLLICSGAALAQTPDGQPPSQETVCDNESGAAYGLCNAYCEAMDCDSNNPSASATACTKVRNKFKNIAGHDVPCEVTCVCADQLDHFTDALNAPLTTCSLSNDHIALTSQSFFGGVEAGVLPDLGIGFCDLLNGGGISITIAEGQQCIAFLRQRATAAGLTCN